MANILHQIKSEKVKLSETSFFGLHLIIPFIGLAVFIGYIGLTTYRPEHLIRMCLQMTGLIFPVIIAVLTSLVGEQEIEAGSAFFLLSVPKRSHVLLSKLVYLIVCGLISCLVLTLGFAVFVPLVRQGCRVDALLLIKTGITLWGSAIFLYLFHTWLALSFGRSANLGVAAFEFLISGLMLTGIGELLWIFIPCTWSSRMMSLALGVLEEDAFYQPIPWTVIAAIVCVWTFLIMVWLFFWFSRWEGRKSEE